MKPEWEDQLREIGNARSNKLYEENLPNGFNRGMLSNRDMYFNRYNVCVFNSRYNVLCVFNNRHVYVCL